MIPVLGVPTVGEPELADMLASIDHPVGDLVVVDNSRNGAPIPDLEHVARVWHLHMPSNLGVATSWNLIIKSTPFAPWWMIVNSDIVCEPGALKRAVERAPEVGLLLRPEPLAPFGAFTVGQGTVSRMGLFDEYYHPLYYEDTDYLRRAQLAGEIVDFGLMGLPDGSAGDSRAFRQQEARNDLYHHNTINALVQNNREFFRDQWADTEPKPKRGWELDRRRSQSVDEFRR